MLVLILFRPDQDNAPNPPSSWPVDITVSVQATRNGTAVTSELVVRVLSPDATDGTPLSSALGEEGGGGGGGFADGLEGGLAAIDMKEMIQRNTDLTYLEFNGRRQS